MTNGKDKKIIETGNHPKMTVNQCDGCQADYPINDRGNHVYPDGSRARCTKTVYHSPVAMGHPLPDNSYREIELKDYIERKFTRLADEFKKQTAVTLPASCANECAIPLSTLPTKQIIDIYKKMQWEMRTYGIEEAARRVLRQLEDKGE